MKILLIFLPLLVFIFPSSLAALPSIQDYSNILLERRLYSWPEWSLPGPFNATALQKDIVYPSWFHGLWVVQSFDLNNRASKPLEYEAKFKLNRFNEVVGDRSFNTLSIGKAAFGDTLLRVQDDPKSPNRQLAIFDEQIFVESKVIGRNQSSHNGLVFFVDELALQIFHNLDVARIKRVETLSKFQLCKEPSNDVFENSICGEQWQAVYLGPGESLESKPIRTNHYQLILRKNIT